MAGDPARRPWAGAGRGDPAKLIGAIQDVFQMKGGVDGFVNQLKAGGLGGTGGIGDLGGLLGGLGGLGGGEDESKS